MTVSALRKRWGRRLEDLGIAGAEGFDLVADGDLYLAGDDDAGFLSLVAAKPLAGIGTGLVGFVQHHQAEEEQSPARVDDARSAHVGHLPQGH